MSRNFVVLEKAGLEQTPVRRPEAPVRPRRTHAALIERLFQGPSVLAIIGTTAQGPDHVCAELAAELGERNRRVLIVPVGNLLHMNPVVAPDEASFTPAGSPNVWRWPVSGAQRIEFFKPRRVDAPGNWLEVIRNSFDTVLLSCPPLDRSPGVAEVAAMAGRAVLVAEAGQTGKQQLRTMQSSLQLRGVALLGSILIQGSNRHAD